jgi:hypothetical protein
MFEVAISYNNTWGPTLADGDDYNLGADFTLLADLISQRNAYNGIGALRLMAGPYDDFDHRLGFFPKDTAETCSQHALLPIGKFGCANSIAEVEEAIRYNGQKFVSYYFDGEPFDKSVGGGQASLRSYYFAHFPTKFFWAEGSNQACYTQQTLDGYIRAAVTRMLSLPKPLAVEVWDTFENSGGQSTEGCISPDPCGVSGGLALQFELNFFDIGFLKGPFNLGGVTSYKTGRVAISPAGNANNTLVPGDISSTFPGLFYTFEIDDQLNIGHWRSMQRGK